MTSVLATVSLSFAAAHHLCRHISSHLFAPYLVLRKNVIYAAIVSLAPFLSIPLYVTDADTFSSRFIHSRSLALRQSLFLLPITYSGVSLSP